MMLEFEPPLYSEIAPRLWLGGTDEDESIYRGRKRLPALNDPKPFDVVVTLEPNAMPMGWHVKELRYAFVDGSIDAEALEEVERISDWAFLEWYAGNEVLIRCQAGLNRSSLVAGLVLLKSGKDFEEVLKIIRGKRGDDALSNPDFYRYLKDWKRRDKR